MRFDQWCSDERGLCIRELNVGYGGSLVLKQINLQIPAGAITAVVGANASGKSTLLRALARTLRPQSGGVYLDGVDLASLPARSLAQRISLLPQAPRAPEGISVGDLVRRGRYPHQRFLRQYTSADERAVQGALELADLVELSERPIDQLSGGQRQRAWLAMVLAQDAATMLLDEPTTYLDISHQVEMLELLTELNARDGRTVVMVLHDLNQACRYATNLVGMANGRIVATGTPTSVVTEDLISKAFGLEALILEDPLTRTPLCVPRKKYVRIP